MNAPQSFVTTAYDEFMRETLSNWHGNDAPVTITALTVDPRMQDFTVLSEDHAPEKFGEYTINPEMATVDWENIPAEKIKIFDFAEFEGEPFSAVMPHIVTTYGDTHHIPGIEFWQWVVKGYNNATPEVKEKYKTLTDGNFFLCLGSLVRDSGGSWGVPCADRSSSGWAQCELGLGYSWDSGYYRIVLLEK